MRRFTGLIPVVAVSTFIWSGLRAGESLPGSSDTQTPTAQKPAATTDTKGPRTSRGPVNGEPVEAGRCVPGPSCCGATPARLQRSDLPPLPDLLHPAMTEAAVPLSAAGILARWEDASRELPRPTDRRMSELARFHSHHACGHWLALVNEFLGPVSAADLEQRFIWQQAVSPAGKPVIQGRPRDVADQLFFRSFEITFDEAQNLPFSICFDDRHGKRAGHPIDLHVLLEDRQARPIQTAGIERTTFRLARFGDLVSQTAVAGALQKWEIASRNLSDSDPQIEKWLAQRSRDFASSTELALLRELCGPIDAAGLQHRYRFRTLTGRDGRTWLEATPLDDLQRRFQLSLDSHSHLPVSIRFSVNGSWSEASSIDLPLPADGSTLTSQQDEPASPAPAMRDRQLPHADRIVQVAWMSSADNRTDQAKETEQAPAARQTSTKKSSSPSATGPTDSSKSDASPNAEASAKPSREIATILARWQAAQSGITALEARLTRFVYDSVFETEERATGRFYFEPPNRGRLEIEPADLPETVRSRRTSPRSGTSYELTAPSAATWIWTGRQLITLDLEARRTSVFQVVDRRKKDAIERAGYVVESTPPLILSEPQTVIPFVFDVQAVGMEKSHDIRLLKHNRDKLWLALKPLQKSAGYREAKVILDRHTFRTEAVQLLDTTGSRETVYTFHGWRKNKVRPGALHWEDASAVPAYEPPARIRIPDARPID